MEDLSDSDKFVIYSWILKNIKDDGSIDIEKMLDYGWYHMTADGSIELNKKLERLGVFYAITGALSERAKTIMTTFCEEYKLNIDIAKTQLELNKSQKILNEKIEKDLSFWRRFLFIGLTSILSGVAGAYFTYIATIQTDSSESQKEPKQTELPITKKQDSLTISPK